MTWMWNVRSRAPIKTAYSLTFGYSVSSAHQGNWRVSCFSLMTESVQYSHLTLVLQASLILRVLCPKCAAYSSTWTYCRVAFYSVSQSKPEKWSNMLRWGVFVLQPQNVLHLLSRGRGSQGQQYVFQVGRNISICWDHWTPQAFSKLQKPLVLFYHIYFIFFRINCIPDPGDVIAL